MYGLNAIALMACVAIQALAVWLCKCDAPTRTKTIRKLCLMLLCLNIVRYALSPLLGKGFRIPVEYSTVAYFAVPVILLTGRKSLQSWAAYSGIMAGFFYYMAMFTAGGPIYQVYPPYEIYLSMYCHGTLYLCGLVMLSTQPYPTGDGYKLIACTAYIAFRALLLRPLVEGTERLFIYELLDGVYIRQYVPSQLWTIAVPGYYVALIGLVFLSIRGFFRLNRLQCRKFVSPQESFPHTVPVL